jgi:hypothetical protein
MTPREALDRFFRVYYERRPVTATFTGMHDHDHRLPDWSPEGLEAAAAEMRDLHRALDRAGRVEDGEVREFPRDVDLALADGFLQIQIAEHEGPHFYRGNPALWTGEAIFSVIALVTRDFAPLADRLDTATARLRATSDFLGAARGTLTGAPVAWREKALKECEAAEILLGRSLPEWGQSLSSSASECRGELSPFVEACASARQAFTGFREWLQRDLPPAPPGREQAGRELLALLLTRGHWCQTPVDDLLGEAREALNQAHAGLTTQLRAAGCDSWPAAHAALATLRPTADDYLSSFEQTWQRCHDAVLAADLVNWPERPIR